MERPNRPDELAPKEWSLTHHVAGGFGTAFILAFLALGEGVLALFAVLYWPLLALFVSAACILACVWAFIRLKTWPDRVAVGVAALVIVGWSLLVGPSGWSGIRHDRIMHRVASAVCSVQPPSGARVVSCRDTGVENPFNGNQCGYQVNIWLQTRLPLASLKAYYGRPELLPSSFHELDITEPYAEQEGPSIARVEFLAVGEEGLDLRCT